MTHLEFNDIVNKRFSKAKKVLLLKAEDYATDADRLRNFKDGAFINQISEEEYALALVTKHFIALRDFITGEKDITVKFIDEKIGDIINYMLLIEAILTEKLEE
jgi:hypothetical protein